MITRTTQIYQPIKFDYFQHQPFTKKMGGACGDHVKTVKTIFVVENWFFGKKVFTDERFRIKGLCLHELQDGYLSSKLHVQCELFPLKNR